MPGWAGRGEEIFVALPRTGSRIYDFLMHESPMQKYYLDIARDVTGRFPGGRLLDVGTGPGRLLGEIHRINPAIELYGLDMSDAMLRQARKNLAQTPVDLRRGNIRSTDFPDETFDLVTCTGSFYLWDRPEEGLREIHRILKKKACAYLFECRREYDRKGLEAGLKENLRTMNPIARILGPLAIRQALEAAYGREEIAEIVRRSPFAGSFRMNDITLSRIPIWVRVELRKG